MAALGVVAGQPSEDLAAAEQLVGEARGVPENLALAPDDPEILRDTAERRSRSRLIQVHRLPAETSSE